MGLNSVGIKKNRKTIENILKKLDEANRKIYLLNEKVASLQQQIRKLK